MKYARGAAWALMIVFLAACTGEAGSRLPEPDDGGGKAKNDDPVPPKPDGSVPCSVTGEPASCDPVSASGCGSASCYLVRDKGPSCVCPAATAGEGDSCNTTTECGPGLVCAGTAAPGICRKTCVPGGTTCLAGTFCRVIDAFPDYGYCDVQ